MVLAHVIMEAEESHNLPFVSWRPRKPVVQFGGLRPKGADDIDSCPSLKT